MISVIRFHQAKIMDILGQFIKMYRDSPSSSYDPEEGRYFRRSVKRWISKLRKTSKEADFVLVYKIPNVEEEFNEECER